MINLVSNKSKFTLASGSSIIPLTEFLNYTSGVLDNLTNIPSNNVLFSYSNNVYDFKNNTIIFGGESDTLTGLFIIDKPDVTIENLIIKINTTSYNNIQGYLISTTGDVTGTKIKNCHIIFDLPDEYGVSPLINTIKYGTINDCSSTYLGTNMPVYIISGICGADCGNNDGNVTINNCYSTGIIGGNNAGGFCGENCGNNGTVTINNCYSTGIIPGTGAGGICGGICGNNGGNVTINNCYSIGNIDDSAGGICGGSAGQNNGVVTITDCYSTGTINIGGGICGTSCGNNGNVNINNCYSTGDITSSSSDGGGGICGYNCGDNGGIVAIKNCYSTGNIPGANSGGICGSSCGNGGNVTINNCYSTGAIGGGSSDSGGICGADVGINTGTVTITCSYTLSGVSPVNDIAQGSFVGGIDMSANFTETNNSYLALIKGVPSSPGVTLSVLLSNCASAYTNKRCVFGGEAPILSVFENSDIWTPDNSCLESFKPQLQVFFNCDVWKINTNIEIFAPKLGFCGCPVDGVWTKTLPGKTVTLDCIDNEKKSRQCDNKGVWESVITESCGGVGLNAKQKATIGITVTIVGVFLLLILFSML